MQVHRKFCVFRCIVGQQISMIKVGVSHAINLHVKLLQYDTLPGVHLGGPLSPLD